MMTVMRRSAFSQHVLRYRVVANKAVIRDGMEISSAQVGELVEGDIVDGWEEMVTDEATHACEYLKMSESFNGSW